MNSPEEVLAQLQITPFGCWEWTRARHPLGYGNVYYQSRFYRAHRLIYTLLTGIDLTGRVLDHLCRNPPCCNPDHLEPVTQQENIRRGNSRQGRNSRKTHCKRGHELTPDNNVPAETARGTRDCLICSKERARTSSTPVRRQECSYCGRSYRRSYMREHQRRVHDIRIT